MSKRAKTRMQQKNKIRNRRFIIAVVGVIAVIASVLVIRQSNESAEDIIVVNKDVPSYADNRALGSIEAPILIQDFSNFPCPHCRSLAMDTLPLIKDLFIESGLVRYEYHYATFDQSVGRFAAEAAECANQQQMFWPYHDMLFANQIGTKDQFSEERLLDFAKELDIDLAQFRTCLLEGESTEAVEKDAVLALEMGVRATPTLFINGEMFEGAQSFEMYKEIIESNLEKK
tara:strand:+ start:357 stop:1046 length:690 start_codon:yes stop_codon:yes gene_type:complete